MTQKITINVSESGTPAARTFAYRISFDGEELADRVLTPVQSQQVREMAAQYISLFEGASKAGAVEYLPILGDGLFHLFLETGWQDFGPRFLQGGDIVIASSISEVLQLPWEYLRLAKGDVIGISERFNICRHIMAAGGQTPESTKLASGPLRVLFLAAEPLDYEREELEILKVAEGLNMVLEVSDKATLEELKDLAGYFRPHVVHLVANGKMIGGVARISMQGTDGKPDLGSVEALASALKGSGTMGVIIGGHQSDATASLELLCQKLAEHLPLVIRWKESSSTIKAFYMHLASGKTFNEALKVARRQMYNTCLEQAMICALPVMYVGSDLANITNFQKLAEVAASNVIHREQYPLPGLSEGYAENFVDRRKDMQRLHSAFVEGRMHTLIVTGPKGVGKSTLATSLAIHLASSGYFVLPIFSSKNNPLSIARLLEMVIGQLSRNGQSEAARKLKEGPIKTRLNALMEVLNDSRFLMIWDGLDLDSKTAKIMDNRLAEFYLQFLPNLGASRVIITCESLPADALTLPLRAWEWQLSGLSKAAFMRFLLQDEAIADKYRRGEITYEKLQEVHSKTYIKPVSPAQMRQAFRMGQTAPGDEALAFLFALLNKASRLALSSCAVYGIAFSLAGLAAVAGVAEDKALAMAYEWQKLSLVYSVGNLWAVPSTSQDYLLAALSPEERHSVHGAAGDFLKSIAESGHSAELGLSRLDCLLEARGHYLAAEDLEDARAVTAYISGYLERRGYYHELISLNQELIMRTPHALPMNWIARAYQDQGNYGKAIESYERVVQIGPDAVAFYGLGTTYLSMDKLDLARDNLQKAMEIWQSSGDLGSEVAALQSLASIDMAQKDEDAAHEKLNKVVEIKEKLGDLHGIAVALQDLAKLDLDRKDHEAALPKLLKSLELLSEASDRIGEAVALYNLGNLEMEMGQFQPAKEHFEKALLLEREIGNRSGEAAILHSLGLIESQVGSKESAWENFKGALQVYQELLDKPGEAGAFFQLGALAVQMDKIKEGLRLMALSALVLRSIKSDEVKNVEPLVERLASQLSYNQEQFMAMVQEAMQSYRQNQGWALVESVISDKK
jgi:tetratricopeptide (TPR) repeat protein